MVCTLCKPGEATVQQACTSSVQFTVSAEGTLDLTVNQRSSDVILGLPHDVIAWSVILHLVRREVSLRTKGKRKIRAGHLHFCIAGGGAHVYEINKENLETLLEREPLADVNPCLLVDDSCAALGMGMFELARSFGDNVHCAKGARLRVAGYASNDSQTCYHSHIKIQQALDG